jgi:hypothetical protein
MQCNTCAFGVMLAEAGTIIESLNPEGDPRSRELASDILECRFMPPAWPQVEGTDWCG